MKYRYLMKRDRYSILFIFLIPFILYAYRLFPEDEQIKIFGMTITSVYFQNVQIMIWAYTQKIIMIMLALGWYYSSKHWWKKAIIVPLTFFVFQFIMLLNEDLFFFDEYEVFYGVVVTLPIVLGFIFIVNKINRQLSMLQVEDEIEGEIKVIISNLSNSRSVNQKIYRQKFDNLKSKRKELTKENYLKELLLLKESILV